MWIVVIFCIHIRSLQWLGNLTKKKKNILLRCSFFQKAHIPQSIMDVIQGKVPCDMHDEFDIVSKDACI